ncbi:MAG TPA: hypothetical protein VL443_02830, partial [Cyclobacteriaceae bacterium]|nr:hypothetical protein [Cyclobacteriaceae bacterium]
AVDAEAELPKISLTSMPYAFTSQLANSVDGANITGTVNASKIGGTLIASNIPALDAGKITTGTLSNALLDADLQDLADGSLSGSKVGTGISATNITTGTLTGALVGTGVSASNVTIGTLSSSVLDPDIADLADGTLASLNVDGFTKLGSDAPLIKIKKLTSTSGSSEGFDVGVLHGITISKLLGILIVIESTTNSFIGPNYTINPELQYSYYTTSTEIRIVGASTNSGSILSKPIEITLVYEQ